MHRPTISALIHCLRISVLSSLLFAAGCSSAVGNDDTCTLGDLTPAEENALYRDLWSRHSDHHNLALPYRGIIESTTGTKPMWVVWMTESSPAGEGIIATYDADHKLRDMRMSRPIKHIGRTALNKEIDVLLVREVSATGTGLYEETMSILDVANLNIPLWSGKVKSWLEGVDGRNEGHILHCVLMLLDLDCDGTKELLLIKIEEVGTTLESILFSRPDMQCTLFSFDDQNHKFGIQKEMVSHILYPLTLKGKDNF